MKRIIFALLLLLPITITAQGTTQQGDPGCAATPDAQTRGGVGVATPAKVTLGIDGLTIEQKNINDRLRVDNTPGSIKHLYIISAYSGQTLLYSTVRGKVTSSGKRLSPSMVNNYGEGGGFGMFAVDFNGTTRYTNEVLSDDGTYGSSVEYLYWWDSAGKYHQHYPSGGQIIHVSDQPIAVKSVVINVEERN